MGTAYLALLLFQGQIVICTPSAIGVCATLLQHYIHDLALHMDAPFPSGLAWQGKMAGLTGLHHINTFIFIGF